MPHLWHVSPLADCFFSWRTPERAAHPLRPSCRAMSTRIHVYPRRDSCLVFLRVLQLARASSSVRLTPSSGLICCILQQRPNSSAKLLQQSSENYLDIVASARRSGQEDFQRGTPPVSLASCSISPFLSACIITEWSSKDHETDSTGTAILIPLLLLNFNMRLHGNPTAWYLFLATGRMYRNSDLTRDRGGGGYRVEGSTVR